MSEIDHTTSGACIMWDGNICKSGEFHDRMKFKNSKYKPTEEQMEKIKNLPFTDLNTLPQIENRLVHEWYEIGNEKYGRTMYCPNTNIKRGLTMGEFYQSATVD
jgi:uncharacterized cysteine cluster protein YcgN (CxxCxxCC family)